MKWLSLRMVGLLWAMLTFASAQAPQPTLVQILANRSVFGKDFPVALTSMPAWGSLEERQVAVFAHQVIGTTPFTTKEEAQKRAGQLNKSLQKLRVRFKRELSTFAKVPAQRLRAQAIPFPEDDSSRVAVLDSSLELINPQLTLALLKEALGPPEKVDYVTIQNKFERLPVQLKLYEYAGGQISFAELSPSPRPGFIDRVILNVRATNTAVFEEVK